VRGFVRGPHGLEGGVVSSSRALLFPTAGNTDDVRAWERALDESIARAVDELRAVVG
jgi:orotidine-5'-phosphate decarboxylase